MSNVYYWAETPWLWQDGQWKNQEVPQGIEGEWYLQRIPSNPQHLCCWYKVSQQQSKHAGHVPVRTTTPVNTSDLPKSLLLTLTVMEITP